MTGSAVLEVQDLRFAYPGTTRGWCIQSLRLNPGETLFLHGESGSGKSTVLNLLAGVLRPDSGQIAVCGHALEGLSGRACDQLRVNHMGFVFQQFNLLGYLTVQANVELPCRFSNQRRLAAEQAHGSVEKAILALLGRLGMAEYAGRLASRLSVGQQQRVALARALIGSPALILADEPTSALDEGHQSRFMDLLLQQARQQGTAVVFVSHDLRLRQAFDRAQAMSLWQIGGAA